MNPSPTPDVFDKIEHALYMRQKSYTGNEQCLREIADALEEHADRLEDAAMTAKPTEGRK